jgi:hypothetical protein
VLGPAVKAVSQAKLDVAAALARQPLLGLLGELFDDLDAVDLAHQRREDRRLIAQAGADLQDPVAGLQVEKIGHQGDDEGL